MNFDLNIENYNRDELIEMFELPSNFDRNIVEIKEAKLKESIINNKEIKKEILSKTLDFLMKAKNILIDTIKQKTESIEEKLDKLYHATNTLKPSELDNSDEHMLQVRPVKPYVTSSPSEFVTSIINPISKKTIRKNLNIDSRFRENYYTSSASNFNIILPTNFNDVLQMQLASIEIPSTYYIVSKQYGNNFFTISVDASAAIVINIPDGNYDKLTIMDAINNQLSLAGAPFSSVVFRINLTNGTTGTGQTLVGFSDDPATHTKLELNFQADRFGISDRNTPLPLKFGWILGFRNGIYIGNKNYVSEGIVDTIGPKYMFLVVDDHNNNVNNNFFSAFNSSILNKNILARITLISTSFSISAISSIQQNNLSIITTPREYFGPVNITNLTIQLLDEYGRIIDLNNMDFSFCLNLVTVYDI
jgi:hypothetical protein